MDARIETLRNLVSTAEVVEQQRDDLVTRIASIDVAAEYGERQLRTANRQLDQLVSTHATVVSNIIGALGLGPGIDNPIERAILDIRDHDEQRNRMRRAHRAHEIRPLADSLLAPRRLACAV